MREEEEVVEVVELEEEAFKEGLVKNCISSALSQIKLIICFGQGLTKLSLFDPPLTKSDKV